MRRSRHTDQEIAFLLKEAETGTAITDICTAAHVSVGTFYRWRRRLAGLPPAGVVRLGEIERENARLRSEVADLRQAMQARPPAPSSPNPRARFLTPIERTQVPSVHHRGGASVGRYAAVRTAN